MRSVTAAPPLLRDRRLWWLLGLGALLRVVVGLHQWQADPTMSALLSDSLYYRAWAEELLGRADFGAEGPGLPRWLPPLYPRVLALVGASVPAMLVLQGLLGLVTTLLVVALGERLLAAGPHRRDAALAGGLLATLYAPVLFFEGRLLGASLAMLLATSALLALARWLPPAEDDAPRGPAWLVLAGGLTGLLALTRPNTLLAVPAVGLWLLVRRRRAGAGAGPGPALGPAVLFALAALLPLLPTLAHNRAAEGELVPVTANGGVNFWFGNNPEAHGTFHAPGPEWGSIEGQRPTSLEVASAAAGRSLTHGEASAWWFREGLAWLAAEPVAAARLWGLKLADSLSSTEYGIQYSLAATRARAPSLWLAPLPFGLLLLLAAVGWPRGGEQRPGARGLAEAWLAAGLVSALLYFTYSRFRLPLLPALLPFAGLGLVRLVRLRVRPLAAAVGLVLLVQSFVPFEGSYPRHLASHAFRDMAAALAPDPATRAERAALLDRALALVPGNKPAATARALVHLEEAIEGRPGAAEAALAGLEAAVAIPVAWPDAEFQLADFLARWPDPALSDPARARTLVTTWLASHPADDPARPAFEALLGQLDGP